jgi:3-phenylpropionate/trans-cinnamate dioxygenase ferredoxin reductase subunit
VTVVESASRLLERAVSPIISDFLLDTHLQHGINVALEETVVSIEGIQCSVASVSSASSSRLRTDLVVIGIGGIANDELARAAGFRIKVHKRDRC